MSLEQAQSLHQQAEWAREKKEYDTALALYAQALKYFEEAESLDKLSEVHASLSITYRHLLSQTNDPTEQAKYKAAVTEHVQKSLEYARQAAEHGNESGQALAFFNAAKLSELEGNLTQAIEYFQQALLWLEQAPPAGHDRPAVRWDFKLKLALAQFANGEAAALDRVLEAIQALQADTGVDADYNSKVWVSGAYLKLAESFRTQDLSRAQEFLAQAKTIIDQDVRLKVRKEEYEKLAQKFAE